MQTISRIPKLQEVSFDGALLWFSELQTKGLLFHPEDDPGEIISIADGNVVFSSSEAVELRFLLEELDSGLGHEIFVEAAYPFFMRAVGMHLDA
ncbi:hypothetical protein [Propionivibrio sp.]|uniref:hypothetical protein n=1 Tax=Propionivibrio sp. TaxID=2212460 RepID=UPI003BF002E3